MLRLIFIALMSTVGCLPQNNSILSEDSATDAQIKEILSLLTEKTGVLSMAEPNTKMSATEAVKFKEIVSGMKIPDKKIFAPVGRFIIKNKTATDTQVYELSFAKDAGSKAIDKTSLKIETAQLLASADATKFQNDLLFHASVSSEIVKLVPEMISSNLNIDMVSGINYKDANLTKERETKIIQKISSLKASIAPLVESVKPLLPAVGSRLVLNFNVEGLKTEGSSYSSGFTLKSQVVEYPELKIDMSALNDAQLFVKSMSELKAGVAAIEQEANVKIGQGVQLRLSFGKTIRDLSQLKAFALDPAMHKKLLELKKSTDLTNFFWLDRFTSEDIYVSAQTEGIYISTQLKDKPNYSDYLGGFLAIAEGDPNEGTHSIALSFPPDVESFVVRSSQDPTKPIYSSNGALKSVLKSGLRTIFSSKEKLDLGESLNMQIEATYKSKKVFKHTISIIKQPS